MSTLAAKDDVHNDGADDGEKDHEPYREIEGEVTPPQYQVAGKPLYPETTEQQKHPPEHEQHDRTADQ
jgi:hypothetical protein